MGNFDLKVNVELNGVIEDIENDIEAGIRDANKKIGRGMKKAAQRKIKREDAVFSTRLLYSFDTIHARFPDGGRAVALSNRAPYSKQVDEGVRGIYGGGGTGGQFTTKRPPLDALLPWVETKLSGWALDATGTRLVPADD